MPKFTKILVATDTRFDQHFVVDEAAKVAKREGAELTIVDVMPELSWAARIAMRDPDHVAELIVNEKQAKLDEIAQRLKNEGVAASSKVLRGHMSLELIRCVLREGFDLVMRSNKGRQSKEQGFFGRTAKVLLRKCPCPLWLMRDRGDVAYKKILACVETSSTDEVDQELNDTIYGFAKEIGRCHESEPAIIHTWAMWNEQMLKSRMPEEEFEQMQQSTLDEEKKQFVAFLERQGRAADDPHAHLVNGDCWETIPNFAKENAIDLIVIGTVGKSGLQGVLMGNTSERILNKVECDVLAVKPKGFRCPIQVD